jgi:hypothetical protein
MNMNEYYQQMYHMLAHDTSGFPALLRAPVIIFVIFVWVSYQFSSVIYSV